MKEKHIVDKLLNIIVILIMLGSTIILYNSAISYFTDEPVGSDYKCDYDEVTDPAIKAELEAAEKCNITEEQLETVRVDFRKSTISDILKSVYAIIIAAGFLLILRKTNLLKDGLTTKILNAILLLIGFSGVITVGALLINGIFFEIAWEQLFRSFGLVVFPTLFYFIINKYILKEKR